MEAFSHGDVAWEVASARATTQVSSVSMAGFRVRRLDSLRMIPHPAVTMLIQIGPGTAVLDVGGSHHHGGFVAAPGLGTSDPATAHGEDVECVQVRLSPVVAHAVLPGLPTSAEQAAVALDDFWGARASNLQERLHDTHSWPARFALIEDMIAQRYAAGPQVDAEVAWAWRLIAVRGGSVRIDRLADEVGWSRKRLWTRFRAQVGMSPKDGCKLVRFDRAAHRLVAGDAPARVAADTGYYDQSHLHRDIVAITGRTTASISAEPFLAVDDLAWPDHSDD